MTFVTPGHIPHFLTIFALPALIAAAPPVKPSEPITPEQIAEEAVIFTPPGF